MGARFKPVSDPSQQTGASSDTGKITVERRVPGRDEMASCDAFVRAHEKATPYHQSAWLKAVAAAYGHSVTMLVALDAKSCVAGVLPLCHLARPFCKPSLISLPFCDLGGPLANCEMAEKALMDEALALAKQTGAKGLSLRLAGQALDPNEDFDTSGIHKVSMLCDLPESGEALIKSYKPKLRSQIRKAEKNGLTSEIGQQRAAIDSFYQVFAPNMKRLGSPVHSLGWFQALQNAYGDNMIVGLVRWEGRVIGAGIVLLNGARAAIPWASTLAEYNHLAPNMLLYWTLLSHVADNGIRQFDFGRSSPGEGTYRFKKQWGAVPHELRWLDYQVSGEQQPEPAVPSASARKLRARVEALWQRLPLALANRLGPMIRKYIPL
jgi:FemAB-related protein (PEP-CTERM system-associated)